MITSKAVFEDIAANSFPGQRSQETKDFQKENPSGWCSKQGEIASLDIEERVWQSIAGNA
jgi:hypothetical protein